MGVRCTALYCFVLLKWASGAGGYSWGAVRRVACGCI